MAVWGCFYRPMNNVGRIDRFEKRVDEELANARREARADFRLLLGALVALMLVVAILGFTAIIAAGS
ncbi:MAG TPA: hypothetical protein VHS74_12235 [Solirubrobacterales bacterium]|jgi:hypothetical protein|nr:hypothetical protein [Solirubrobacterales bacterium]